MVAIIKQWKCYQTVDASSFVVYNVLILLFTHGVIAMQFDLSDRLLGLWSDYNWVKVMVSVIKSIKVKRVQSR